MDRFYTSLMMMSNPTLHGKDVEVFGLTEHTAIENRVGKLFKVHSLLRITIVLVSLEQHGVAAGIAFLIIPIVETVKFIKRTVEKPVQV